MAAGHKFSFDFKQDYIYNTLKKKKKPFQVFFYFISSSVF